MVNFGEFLKTWSLRLNSVTRQVIFNRTKIGRKKPKLPKMSYLTYLIFAFSTTFCPMKIDCLATLFDRKLLVSKNSPKWIIFGIFHQLLATKNVNVARFARNVEWDFFCEFQTLCFLSSFKAWEKDTFFVKKESWKRFSKFYFLSYYCLGFSHPLIFLWSEKAVHISVDKGGYPLLLLFMAKRGASGAAVELELRDPHRNGSHRCC